MTVKFMNEVFDKHNVGQDYRDYIFEDTNNIPQYLVMWNWNDILKDLNKKIELTNKLMIRIYDLCIGSAEIAGLKDFLHFELYNDKVESNYDKKSVSSSLNK